ncbi:uncharacterized protein LOC110462085 isoform X2 [Mizuhopecten yessoensis]|uniref:uncharacterized protein LOC110462085 isoform X2 n=1 Tax=Mizuhopecten yessoensis TaxID=6573 RepID=UPI000B4589A0|nr:uncharacterized protein LOC110462085 isoform X2 [Mizuhopecten yessoensis]
MTYTRVYIGRVSLLFTWVYIRRVLMTYTGVYIGMMNDDYKGGTGTDLKTMNNYSLTGTSPSIASARVSYTYNLLGPSITLDTACSSALVAIHIGSQALKTGECNAVICGGVNSILYPDIFVPLSKARMVSPTGQCQTFSDKADGYARGEGCGIVILKTKKQALLDGNKIWASIATACNQDGRTMTPITAPSGLQQRNLLHKLYADKGVNPEDISYIEAHGTGTPVGDPIEANTLGKFFAEKQQGGHYRQNVFLGSVKTNIGHLESAAGVAGLIKVLLMMDHGNIVPSLHFKNPNPNIEFEKYWLVVPHNMTSWPCTGIGRVACVNSFGFGGTNSHAIIKQHHYTAVKELKSKKENHIVTISGSDITSLKNNLFHLKRNIHKAKYCVEDVSYTSTCRRDHYPYRVALQACTKEDVERGCDEQLHTLTSLKPTGFSRPNVIFVFCGVGTTWTGMCQELLKKEHIFKDTVKSIDNILTPLAGWSILQMMTDGFDALDPLKGHLAIFTCQVALTKLWNHFGIYPDIIVGQSVGEVAAAYTAGVLSLADAVKVIYQRSVMLAKATGGSMLVISNCYVAIVASVCKKYKDKVNIAVYNSAKSCTLSGDTDAIDEVIHVLRNDTRIEDKFHIRRLDVQCAYHSHHMETASEELEISLTGLKRSEPKCTLISTVTGEKANKKDFASSEYWRKNVRQPVLFQHAITRAHVKTNFNIYLEIGPRPVLRFHLGDIVGNQNATSLPSITAGREWNMMQLSLMELYRHGIDPHWLHVVADGNLTDIPKSLFNLAKLFFQSDATTLKYDGVQSTGPNHLFVERSGGDEIQFKVNISPSTTWFVYQHVVSGTILVPGAFYIDVAIEVCKATFKNQSQKDISIAAQFIKPLSLRKGEACTAEVSVKKFQDELSMSIYKNKEIVAECQICKRKMAYLDTVDLETIRKRCKTYQSASQTYQNLNRLGFGYGKDLQILRDCVKSDAECLVNMTVSDSIFKDISSTNLHPSILDGLLQTVVILDLEVDAGTTPLPGGIESIVIRQTPEKNMVVFTSLVYQTKDIIRYNALLLTEDGRVVAEVRNLFILCIGATDTDEQECMYQLQWEEIEKKAVKIVDRNVSDVPLISIVVSSKPDDAEILGLEIKEMSFLHIPTYDTHFEDILTCHLQKNTQVVQSIILSAEKDEKLEKLTGEDVMRRVFQNASTLLQICQLLVKMKREIPVLIITERTQSIDKSHNCVKNVIGSELWGMTRTIVLEYPLLLTLIDRHVSLELCCSSIRDLLVFQAPQLCSEAEILVTERIMYSNRLVKLQDQPGEYRWISLENTDQVHVKAYSPNDIQEKFCLLQNPETKLDKLLMEVETAVLHDWKMFPLTLQSAENDIPVWIKEKGDGFDIITFEVSGKLIKHSSEKSIEGTYVSCSIFSLQSIVEVPEGCTMRIDDLPNYKPGLLRMSSLLWPMKDHILKGKTLILTDQNVFSGEVLRTMLSKPVASQVTIASLDSFLNSDSHHHCKAASTVVILTTSDITTLENILIRVEGVHTLLSIDMFTTKSDWQSAKKNHDAVSFRILRSEEMLDRKFLSETVPKVAQWLRKKLPKMKNSDENATTAATVVDLKETKQRIKRVKVKKKQLFRRNSCYIIIGGLTGLGWEIVKYLAQSGAGRIVTLSRSHPKNNTLGKIAKLEETTSAIIKAIPADITNVKSLQEAFDMIDCMFGKQNVKGIFHGGAVLDDALFTKQTHVTLRKVLLPKVLGSWNIHTVSKRYDLDFFILHSSIASVFGNKGQSNYSAGNAFMDSIAHYRATNGLPGLSVNWGPLSVGMATANEELEKIGYMFLGVTKIIDTLERMIMSEGNQIIAGVFKWSFVNRQFSDASLDRMRKRFKRVIGNTSRGNIQAATENSIDLDSDEGITGFVIDVASRVFAVGADLMDRSTPISQLGIDSMVAMTFVSTINDATTCTIPIVFLLSDETTIGEVVNYIKRNKRKARNVENVDTESAVTNGLTYMEKNYFKDVEKYPVLLRRFIYVDFEVSGRFADKNLWEAILTHVVNKHPSLRTRFIPSFDNEGNQIYTRKVLPQDEIAPDVREVQRGTVMTDDYIPSDLDMYTFDPASQLPLRLLFENKSNGALIRIVFSHITFDMTSVMLAVEEMQLLSELPGIPPTVASTPDIVSLVNNRLSQQHAALTAYWKENIPDNITSMSFLSSYEMKLDAEHVSTMNQPLPQQLLTRLTQFVGSNKITLFQLIVTAYQCLLHSVLGIETVAVLTVVDMRMHFPQLQKEIGCLINTVPLFLTLQSETQLQNLLTENAKRIRSVMANSLFPLELLEAEVAQKVDPASVFRHKVNFRDSGKANFDTNDGSVKVLKAVSPGHGHETVLIVWNDRANKKMQLELEYSTLVIDETKAGLLLKNLVFILEFFIDHPVSNVQEMAQTTEVMKLPLAPRINDNVKTMQIKKSESKTQFRQEKQAIQSGQFVKQTRKGWNHTVQLSVCRGKEGDSVRTLLRWNKLHDKYSREIEAGDILKVERTVYNGLETLLVRTKKRLYTFMTPDQRLCQGMVDCLVKELQRVGEDN